MDLHNWGKLLVKIEAERRRLYDVSLKEPHNAKKLIQVSERLDELINMYHQEVKMVLQ